MANKANFSADEWSPVVASPMVAGTAIGPRGRNPLTDVSFQADSKVHAKKAVAKNVKGITQ